MHIGFRRALTLACGMWSSFTVIDVAVVRYLGAGPLGYFVALRVAVLAVLLLIRLRMQQATTPSESTLRRADLVTYTAAAVGIALMCVEFRGLASPYVPGCCLVLLGRTVTAQDPWKRGIAMSGVPVAAFFAVLIGSALFSPAVAAQFADAAAITTLLVNSAYVLSTYVLLVICGHIVWSLRRQVFEARSLGRYRLKRRLATGGMGDVWVAYHPGLKRDVAVKILRPEQQERSGSALGRFEREVRATAELMHPNTVRVFDYGATEDGLWYYVMELLQGETLAEHVARIGPLPTPRAVHIVGQAARALAEAHDRGIVHRDVKPENLFLTSLGGEHDFVKVIDFGIAKVQSANATMTDTGWVLGTPAYMSPEVASGDVADARSDVYALGAVLYFLLCGHPPFEAENAAAVIFAQVHESVKPPSDSLGRPIPSDVEAVVMRALEKEPAARYANAAELALALASCTTAGKWTFGHAIEAARKSSRPPASGVLETLPPLAAPRVPKINEEETLEGPALPKVTGGSAS
ncbi:MAG TPA: serine/threonine-protein kinase [Polyangiaceae bacterium]|nr:serine/threonine-protein kinase [Polyangiaceae bacterium]